MRNVVGLKMGGQAAFFKVNYAIDEFNCEWFIMPEFLRISEDIQKFFELVFNEIVNEE